MAVQECRACFSVVELPTLTTVQMAGRAAIELEVFDIIAEEGPDLPATKIVSCIRRKSNRKADPEADREAAKNLDRILALLSAYGFLISTSPTRSRGRTYSLPKMSHYPPGNTKDTSMVAHLFSIFGRGPSEIDRVDVLKEAVLKHNIQKHSSKTPGEFQDSNSTHKAMEDFTKLLLDGMFDANKGFKDVKELMAVAGGNKTVRQCNLIKIQGVKHIKDKEDMFQSLPKAETILLKSVFPHWDDAKCKEWLKIFSSALVDNGKIIILEFIVPEKIENTPEARMVTSLDVRGLTDFETKERTLDEYKALAESAGFLLDPKKVFHKAHGFHVMEFKKSG
ncbi:hypothetical protein SLEP1_g47915 [Rubroshorea leprosula]|uniref:O-methyltransferase domain-containing protein n=1 Tax=Rubroshorea leprosula TaxID=152421 RepID=A0AAV5LSX6_9ROSI|nr:hypothetical protein SLEP1_g47915 [Rubroshorea leprosula]